MTESTRSRRLRRAAIALAAAGALASATAFAVAATESVAGAASTRHSITGTINGSPAVENSVRASFNCDSSSGQWSFKISNVQVISADHTTPWTTFGVTFSYGKTPTLRSHNVSLTQDLRNGLFDGTASGSDGPLNAFCVTAASFKVGDADTDGGNLFIIANIR